MGHNLEKQTVAAFAASSNDRGLLCKLHVQQSHTHGRSQVLGKMVWNACLAHCNTLLSQTTHALLFVSSLLRVLISFCSTPIIWLDECMVLIKSLIWLHMVVSPEMMVPTPLHPITPKLIIFVV